MNMGDPPRIHVFLDMGSTETICLQRTDDDYEGDAEALPLSNSTSGGIRSEVYAYRDLDGEVDLDARAAVHGQEPPIATYGSFKGLLMYEQLSDVPSHDIEQLRRIGLTTVGYVVVGDNGEKRPGISLVADSYSHPVDIVQMVTVLIQSVAVEAKKSVLLGNPRARRVLYQLTLAAPSNATSRYRRILHEAGKTAFNEATGAPKEDVVVTIIPEPVAVAMHSLHYLDRLNKHIPKVIVVFDRGGLSFQVAVFVTFGLSCRQIMSRSANLGGMLEDAEVHRTLTEKLGPECTQHLAQHRSILEQIKVSFSHTVMNQKAMAADDPEYTFDLTKLPATVDQRFIQLIRDRGGAEASLSELDNMFKRAQEPLARFLAEAKPEYDAVVRKLGAADKDIGFIFAGGGMKCAGILPLVSTSFGLESRTQYTPKLRENEDTDLWSHF